MNRFPYRRPRVGACFNKESYWQEIETVRDFSKTHGQLPEWAFDFVSVHSPTFLHGWGLCSPLCLCMQSSRPEWENQQFPKRADAIKRAKEIARANGVFVVICD